MRTRGSAAELEVKRRIAGNLLLEGRSRAEVARLVKASWSSVNRWQRSLQKGGIDALAAKPHPGRPPRLSQRQQGQIQKILLQGAHKAGYPTDLWTCLRVQEVIEKRFGVKYDHRHVWRLLCRWEWSPQKPQSRPREQDRQAVEHWQRHRWARLKKGDRSS